MRSVSQANATRRPNRWPALVFGLIGTVVFAIGASLTIQRLVILHSWRETTAQVVESRVATIGSQYRAHIRVRLELPGNPSESEPAHDFRGSKHGWIAEVVDAHAPGTQIVVHRDPREPTRTRLAVGWNYPTFGFPLILVGIGLIVGAIAALANRSAELEVSRDQPRTRAEARRLARAQYLGFAAFLGVIAAAMFVAGAMLVRPAWRQREWPVVTGRVERSDIFTRSSGSPGRHNTPSTFYVGRLFVSYAQGGRSFESVALLRGSSSDRTKIERRLAAIPPGTSWPLRVNPASPHETLAVGAWPLVLPLVFVGVGLVLGGVTILLIRAAPDRK